MDKERVGTIYARNRSFMFGYAYSCLGNREDAEEVVQNTGIRMMTQREDPPDERAFAFTLVRHEVLGFLQYQHRQMRDSRLTVPLNSKAHDKPVESAEEAVLKRESIEESDAYARAFGEGYTGREIAEHTRMHEKAIYDRVAIWRTRESGREQVTLRKDAMLHAIENFERYWIQSPLNALRRAHGFPETTTQEILVFLQSKASLVR